MLAIETSLGSNTLGLRSVSIEEEVGRPFIIEAELSSLDGRINLDKVVGFPAGIRLDVAGDTKRYFHGIICRMSQSANQGEYAHYHATIVPWLWLLTRTSDCRIFQGKKVPDIIKEVFSALGFTDFEFQLSGDHQVREFCVQYRETDFNFVSRLMEEEGIYYFFKHEAQKHTMVLADSISAHGPFPEYATVDFLELQRAAPGKEAVHEWSQAKEIQPVAYAHTDFDFTKPKTSLMSKGNVTRQHGHAKYEIYDYPGGFRETGDGTRLADIRLQELQAPQTTFAGQASARGLAAGHTFKLKNHPRDDQNAEYLVTRANLTIDAGEFASVGTQAAGEFFTCEFEAILKAQQFRAPRTTPKPVVQGPQTAIVVGPSGEEIHTDEYGRVKVQFHWDHVGKKDQNSSCWVRVSQFWAGKQWGSIHVPRIGQEVIVEFLEGDPDCPIITGRVYNADQMPPYELPANKTQSGVKSRSSLKGTPANFNEIRFEDKKGSEEVYIHAEKDQNKVVENDETTSVGHDRTETVGHDETITIDNNRTETVKVNEDISVGSNRTEKVGSNETITVGANRTRNVGANESVTVAQNRTHSVGINEAITVGAAQEITVGAAQTITVGAVQAISVGASQSNDIGKNQTDNIGGERSASVGKDDTLTVGKKLTITAGEEIVIKTGEASIMMKKDGTIQIKGKDVTVKGSGKISIKADSDVTIKGSKVAAN
jgi:type VI secretion system secreted protein VgrG